MHSVKAAVSSELALNSGTDWPRFNNLVEQCVGMRS